MSEKLAVTQTQADAIERIRDVDDAINGQLFNMNESDPLMSLSAAELARALHVGYDVEHIFKVGDWVITEGYSKDYDGKPLEIIQIKNDGEKYFYFEQQTHPDHNFASYHIKRYATSEEIQQEKQRRWWKKHDREVWELKINDEVISKSLNERFDVVHIFENGDINIENVNENTYGQKGIITVQKATVNNYYYKVVCFAEDRKDL